MALPLGPTVQTGAVDPTSQQLSVPNALAANTATISAAGTVTLKAAPGRLVKVLVTTSAAGAITFFDNASAGSGTIIGLVPASATVGTIYSLDFPALAGITYTAAATPSTVTVSWN